MNDKQILMLSDLIVLILSIIMIFNTFKVAYGYFNEKNLRHWAIFNNIIYIIVIIISIFGIDPNTYINLVKSLYQLTKTSLVGAYDSNDIMIYSMVINFIISIIVAITLATMKLTKNVYMFLGILTSILIITRALWGFRICSSRYNKKHQDRIDQNKMINITLEKIGNSDVSKIYRSLFTILKLINNYDDLENVNLKNLDLENVNLEKNKLKDKINQLEMLNKN